MFKILPLGDFGSGKTSLAFRFVEDTFNESVNCETCSDWLYKTVQVGGEQITVKIVDTEAQERFGLLPTSFYRNTDASIIVFDVSNQESFNNAGDWLQMVGRYAPKNVIKILVGAKCDLINRVVDYDTAKQYANEQGIEYMETSAKHSANVEELFIKLIVEIRQRDAT